MEHDPTPTSEQIRLMLEMHPKRMSLFEWSRLDDVMLRQLDKHGRAATAWWFDNGKRNEWRTIAQLTDEILGQ